MRYVILGAKGQLGKALCLRLPGAAGFGHEGGDITHPNHIRSVLRSCKPRIVINCAAYNHVDRAESEPELAFAVNAFGVRNVAIACRDFGAMLVHISTDYVFGFDTRRTAKTTPYRERDIPAPLSVYGASKLAGEYFVRSTCPKHLIVRTCGLYGGKNSFVQTILRLASEGKPLRVVNDQVCTPSYVVDVAYGITRILRNFQHGHSSRIRNLTNAGACTWYEFAQAILAETDSQSKVVPITSSEYGAAARRPAYSVLANRKPLRHWRDALREHLEEK